MRRTRYQGRHAGPRERLTRSWIQRGVVPLALASTAAAAVVATTGAALGTAADGAGASTAVVLPPRAAPSAADLERLESRALSTSRAKQRTVSPVRLEPRVVDREYATEPLNVWTGPREQGPRHGVIADGTRLGVTGQVVGGWAEILTERGKARWVNARYLAEKKPKPEPETTSSTSTGAVSTGLSTAPCPDGSSIEYGLTDAADRVYRAVCAAFPQPTTYGGLDPHGEHVDGRAIDIMISGDVGWQIAEWLRANASTLGIRDIIYAQRIWTPDQASSGWRYMEDRGSITANHYDHVHVAVY